MNMDIGGESKSFNTSSNLQIVNYEDWKKGESIPVFGADEPLMLILSFPLTSEKARNVNIEVQDSEGQVVFRKEEFILEGQKFAIQLQPLRPGIYKAIVKELGSGINLMEYKFKVK